MLVPGFTVRELPVKLTNLNNVEYAADGRLFAGGYDGRFHVLRDTNGDGLEDKVDTFAPATNENYPLGRAVKDGAPTRCNADKGVAARISLLFIGIPPVSEAQMERKWAQMGSVRACVQNAQQFGLGVNEKGRNSVSVDGG